MRTLASPPPDGTKLLMVAQELVMILFCLLYAYPHIPSRIIDDKKTTMWYSIGSKAALRMGITNLLRNSEVLQVSLAAGRPTEDLSWDITRETWRLDEVFDLSLFHESVPAVCVQMYATIAAVYALVTNDNDIATREQMQWMVRPRCRGKGAGRRGPGSVRGWPAPSPQRALPPYQQSQLLRYNFELPSDRSDRSGLLTFCAQQTVDWMQPYFAATPMFYQGRELRAVCR